jgi:3-methylcrotonyl-CoA carboxylase alpha subunit
VQVRSGGAGQEPGWQLELGGAIVQAQGTLTPSGGLQYRLGARSGHLDWLALGRERVLFHGDGHVRLQRTDREPFMPEHRVEAGELRAPMPGRIIALLVEPGQDVGLGAPLLVLEAMKMEHTLKAPRAGRVAACHCALGEQVEEGRELIEFLPLQG